MTTSWSTAVTYSTYTYKCLLSVQGFAPADMRKPLRCPRHPQRGAGLSCSNGTHTVTHLKIKKLNFYLKLKQKDKKQTHTVKAKLYFPSIRGPNGETLNCTLYEQMNVFFLVIAFAKAFMVY